jgi:hypothetical protein
MYGNLIAAGSWAAGLLTTHKKKENKTATSTLALGGEDRRGSLLGRASSKYEGFDSSIHFNRRHSKWRTPKICDEVDISGLE